MHVVMVPPLSAIEFGSADFAGGLPASSVRSELRRRSTALIAEVVRNGGGVALQGSTDVPVKTAKNMPAENSLGWGITCWFASSVDAVLASVELQQVFLKDVQRHGDASVGLGSIGVSFGEIVVSGTSPSSVEPNSESTVLGNPVSQAVGLATLAPAGSIVVSAPIALGMQSIDGIRFVALPEQLVDGTGELQSPSVVDWGRFPNLAQRLGMPARLVPRPSGLLGRETRSSHS